MADVIVEKRYDKAQQAILKGLLAFNHEALGAWPFKTVAVTIREGEAIAGGAVGEIWGGWLFIKLLWLDEALRGRKLGSRAVAALEEEARRRGATQAYVDTFSFQAPEFYRKLGYREFGRLDGWPRGNARHWMTKSL